MPLPETEKVLQWNNDRTQYRQRDHHEAIVSRDVFNAANHLRASRTYKKKNHPLPVLSVVDDGILVVRGCDENDKDALRWCIAKPDKRKSRKMSCKPFSELVYNEMGWDSDCRYKILGYRINFEGETLYVFDLLVPEIFHEGQKRKKGESTPQSEETKPVNTRKGFYPDDIAGTFGVPVEEHLKESEVKQIDGYVSMGILTGKAPGTSAD